MQNIAILIPAAGASSRMRGRDKLLELVDGLPLLRRQAKRAIFTGAHVTVCIRHHANERAQALTGLPVQLVEVPDADLGMSSSLRRGVAHLPSSIEAVMILPADMPEIDATDLVKMSTAFYQAPVPMLYQATSADGRTGHPVMFPRDCFAALQQLGGDQGARQVIEANRHRLRPVPLPDLRALIDLDTPEAWAAWRRAQLPLPA